MNRITGSLAAGLLAIIAGTLGYEGLYSDNPYDPGGKTMYGITEQTARANGYTGEMKNLSQEKATEIYLNEYMVKPNLHLVGEAQLALAEKIFDAGVNVGTPRAAKWFQESLNYFSRGGKDYPLIVADGMIGPKTIEAFQNLQRKRGTITSCELIIKAMDAKQGAHYLSLSIGKEFGVGWFDKRIQNVPLTACR